MNANATIVYVTAVDQAREHFLLHEIWYLRHALLVFALLCACCCCLVCLIPWRLRRANTGAAPTGVTPARVRREHQRLLNHV